MLVITQSIKNELLFNFRYYVTLGIMALGILSLCIMTIIPLSFMKKQWGALVRVFKCE